MGLEEIKLIAVGAAFAWSLVLSGHYVRQIPRRVLGDAVLTLVAVGALYLLRLSIDGDVMDFLSLDFGMVLVAGIGDFGGLVPHRLRDTSHALHPAPRRNKPPGASAD